MSHCPTRPRLSHAWDSVVHRGTSWDTRDLSHEGFPPSLWDHVLAAGWRHPLVNKGLPFVLFVWGLFLPTSFIHSPCFPLSQ
ncbi:hypothetical protein IG631_22689, partial [Alternaria alternata]